MRYLRRSFVQMVLLVAVLSGPGAPGVEVGAPSLATIEALANEQKYAAALEQAKRLIAAARSERQDLLWAKALVKEMQLTVGLHGYETAVQNLLKSERPKDPIAAALVEMAYVDGLKTYLQSYWHEISGRESVAQAAGGDLRHWTVADFFSELVGKYAQLLRRTDVMANPIPQDFSDFVRRNNYPDGVRPVIRDWIVYEAAALLANSMLWTTAESNDTFLLPVEDWVRDEKAPRGDWTKPGLHPLARLQYLLMDHGDFHRLHKRAMAVQEADYVRLQSLFDALSSERHQELIRLSLERYQKRTAATEWWPRGQFQLASMHRSGSHRDRLLMARTVLEQATSRFPKATATGFCWDLLADLTRPEYSFRVMNSDGLNRPSLALTYRNMDKIHFRAFAYDHAGALARPQKLRHQDYEEFKKAARDGSLKPVASWSETLPGSDDLREHRLLVTPPIKKAGTYMVVASIREDFAEKNNHVLAAMVNISDIVALTEGFDGMAISLRVLNGGSGRAVPGAKVTLHRYSWELANEQIDQATTDAKGQAVLRARPVKSGEYWNYFLIIRHQGSFSFVTDGLYFYPKSAPVAGRGSLVFLDRAVYRPGQKIQFKVATYRQEKPMTAKFQSGAPGSLVTIKLRDPNNQEVAKRTIKSNAFGTVAGDFEVPVGRPLGNWRIVVEGEYAGMASVRVEEYKRPTFEVALQSAVGQMRLNQKVKVRGEAKYHFGQPVRDGKVNWRVVREQDPPWWFRWHWWGPTRPPQVIAAGSSALDPSGRFTIEFLPQADPAEANDKTAKLTRYRFQILAEVRDLGGETRAATRTYRIGFVDIDANIAADKGFWRDGERASFRVRRSSLDGELRPGEATYRVVRLKMPKGEILPASLPRADWRPEGKVVADDDKRARWETNFTWQSIASGWSDGESVEEGKFRHLTGEDELTLKALPAGAYRLHYMTRDESGGEYKMSLDFLVGHPQLRWNFPLLVEVEKSKAEVGDVVRALVTSGLAGQRLEVVLQSAGRIISSRTVNVDKDKSLIEIPVTEEMRGGFALVVWGLRDYQFLRREIPIEVPWSEQKLNLEIGRLRDQLQPGARETVEISVTGSNGKPLAVESAEVMAWMFDRSLEAIYPYSFPNPLDLYPRRTGASGPRAALGEVSGNWLYGSQERSIRSPVLLDDELIVLNRYGIGGPGQRHGHFRGAQTEEPASALEADRVKEEIRGASAAEPILLATAKRVTAPANVVVERNGEAASPDGLRSDFSEAAFFQPQLRLGEDGRVKFEFTVPDSVTSWRIIAGALTRDWRAGSVERQVVTAKDLLVRPYLPRFLRAGDEADLKVVIHNGGKKPLRGDVALEIENLVTGRSALADFSLTAARARLTFSAAASGDAVVNFRLRAPLDGESYAFKVVAKADRLRDGERREVPLLPARVRLAESRFVTLKGKSQRQVSFKDLGVGDSSYRPEQLVLTVDGQLFTGVLAAVPYLIDYPYECSEQTLNRYLAAGILGSVFGKSPAVAAMAKKLAERKSAFAGFDGGDANRLLRLEESPWLIQSQGGDAKPDAISRVLDPRVARTIQAQSLERLKKLQLPSGGFPWFQGGPADKYMTLYILLGLSRAIEFGIDVPKDVVARAWRYVGEWLETEIEKYIQLKCCFEFGTMANFTLSQFRGGGWGDEVISAELRKKMLDLSFQNWRDHSPLLKGYLALTLQRGNRPTDAKLVWTAVMDSIKNHEDLGSYWAPEERSWLWYNDTIESHAFAIRTLLELEPDNRHLSGLVQWLFLNKKLNQWKSTRATAEVLYALVLYLEKTRTLDVRETIVAEAAGVKTEFDFPAGQVPVTKTQVVVGGERLTAPDAAEVRFFKETAGMSFASATWHFSTESAKTKAGGDLFRVERALFRRDQTKSGPVLTPLKEGEALKVGDQIEVQLSIRATHQAEYVHLRDPRGAGFEPEGALSGYKWDLGISWYEEIRDSGTSFFFSQLPAGQYTLKYRLRVNMAGRFRVAPATLQSMYAPEFTAYSGAHLLVVK